MYDEPFADSSQIPTHLVCRAARQHVTVALSGDAGDELFGGYNRYFWGARIWRWLASVPYPVRQALSAAIAGLPVSAWDAIGVPLNAMLPGNRSIARVGDRAHKLAVCLRGVHDIEDLYLNLVTTWQDPAAVVRGDVGAAVVEPPSGLDEPLPVSGVDVGQQRMMYRDCMTYLPDDILCKVDRAAMATSLETRVPFLDHRVAELAWQLPLSLKIRGNQGKWALRQILYKYAPRDLIERPKTGFGIPLGQWLRGPLRAWAESLLNENRLLSEGYLNPQLIRETWQEHLIGYRDWTPRLWSVLMFQAWLEANS
jgi:asparagine synthase (glutamine-hydrolysing)